MALVIPKSLTPDFSVKGRKPTGPAEVDLDSKFINRGVVLSWLGRNDSVLGGVYARDKFTTNIINANTTINHRGINRTDGTTGYLESAAGTYSNSAISEFTIVMSIGVNSSIARGVYSQGGSSSAAGNFDLAIVNGKLRLRTYVDGGAGRQTFNATKNIRNGLNKSKVVISRNLDGDIFFLFGDGTIETFSGDSGTLTGAQSSRVRRLFSEADGAQLAFGGIDYFHLIEGAASVQQAKSLIRDPHQILRPIVLPLIPVEVGASTFQPSWAYRTNKLYGAGF